MERLLTSRYEFRRGCPINPEMAEKYGVKMKKPGEVTLESEFEKIKTVRTSRLTSNEEVVFSFEQNRKLCLFTCHYYQ